MLKTKNIENAMAKAKMSKATLCHKVNIARTTFDAILNGGDTKVSTLEAIANVLNVPIGYFFNDENQTRITTTGDYSPAPVNGDVAVIKDVVVNDEELSNKIKKGSGDSSLTDINNIEITNEKLLMEVEWLKKLISEKERLLEEKDKNINEKDRLINFLTSGKKNS